MNGWLAGDDRSFVVRCPRGDGDGETGIARAWLPDGYKTIDHLGTLMATFDGIRASGQQVTIDSCDLRFLAPGPQVLGLPPFPGKPMNLLSSLSCSRCPTPPRPVERLIPMESPVAPLAVAQPGRAR